MVIDSAEENAFVAKLIEEAGWQDVWIGITDEAQENKWLTVTGKPVTYFNWLTNQPNNKNKEEHYALMSGPTLPGGEKINWRWSDQPNRTPPQLKPGFVCEWMASEADQQTILGPPAQITATGVTAAPKPPAETAVRRGREAAQWLLDHGGLFAITVDGSNKDYGLLSGKAELPKEPFFIHYIEGTQSNLTDEHLAELAPGLTKLQAILGNNTRFTVPSSPTGSNSICANWILIMARTMTRD